MTQPSSDASTRFFFGFPGDPRIRQSRQRVGACFLKVQSDAEFSSNISHRDTQSTTLASHDQRGYISQVQQLESLPAKLDNSPSTSPPVICLPGLVYTHTMGTPHEQRRKQLATGLPRSHYSLGYTNVRLVLPSSYLDFVNAFLIRKLEQHFDILALEKRYHFYTTLVPISTLFLL
jgi:hypothetical protein